MSNKHTPGPWAFTEGRKRLRESSHVHKASDAEFNIALVNCEWANELQRAEDVANARLIAAAPELLDAARAALAALYEISPGDHRKTRPLQMLRDAIAKAEGGEAQPEKAPAVGRCPTCDVKGAVGFSCCADKCPGVTEPEGA